MFFRSNVIQNVAKLYNGWRWVVPYTRLREFPELHLRRYEGATFKRNEILTVTSDSAIPSRERRPRVLIIIPAFNEARSLPRLVGEIRSLHPQYDIAVINDGSTDDTVRIARDLPARVITLPCNLGIGGAMQTGFRIACDEQYDVAVQVDGDGQHPVEEIDLLVNDVLQTGSDIVIGSRFLTGAGYQSTASRRLGIRIFSVWLSAICHTRITDATSGFRAFNARAIALLARSYAEDYPEVEAIVVAHRAALSIHEVPVRMAARSDGVSSIGGLRSIGYMFKVSLAILMCSIRRPEIAP